jgi:hypothetical protein
MWNHGIFCPKEEGFDDLVQFFGLEPSELRYWVPSPSGTLCEVSPRYLEVERSLGNLAILQVRLGKIEEMTQMSFEHI